MKKNSDVYKNYLHDLGILIKEIAINAKKREKEEQGVNEKSYNSGYLMGIQRIISLMQEQAEAFRIDLKAISLNDIDPYEDLL
jgi:hypothetical protein